MEKIELTKKQLIEWIDEHFKECSTSRARIVLEAADGSIYSKRWG